MATGKGAGKGEGLVLVFVFWIRSNQWYYNGCLGFINEARAMIHTPACCLVEFHLACGNQRQAFADVIDGFIRQGMAVARSGVGVLGYVCQYALHDTQNAFFLGGVFLVHNGLIGGWLALTAIVTQIGPRGGLAVPGCPDYSLR